MAKYVVVDNFTYFGLNGLKFIHTGNVSGAVKSLQDQALKAYNNLLYLFDRCELDLKTKSSLLESDVVPVLLYGSKVGGVNNLKL